MATEGQFVRGGVERSSRHAMNSGNTANSMTVEIARQRALQAAEYYHRNVLHSSSGSNSSASTSSGDSKQGSRDGYSRVNGSPGDRETEALRAGVTPASSDAYYKAKLREGFIDMRNSYNERHKPRITVHSRTTSHPSSSAGTAALGKVHEGLQVTRSTGGGSQAANRKTYSGASHRSSLTDRTKGLYRSNSSLELDHLDYIDGEGNPSGTLRRDYGSASSLDVMSTSGESFFAMLQDYRNENFDQRAPAPPQMRELLRGRMDNGSHANPPQSIKVANGAVPGDHEVSPDGSQSPKMKTKSQKNKDRKPGRAKSMANEGSSGLFRKLRGTKSEPAESAGKNSDSTDGDPRTEEKQRKKAFVHYDCQSIGISLSEVIKRRNCLNKRRNTTTGASAASRGGAGSELEDNSGEEDPGDGKSNDLVLSCSFFRNEVGGEEERSISLNRVTAQRRVQQLLSNRHIDQKSFIKSPMCNGVAVLDTSQSPTGQVQTAMVSYKGYVVEHVDHGAFYYRNFFHGFDHQNFFGLDENIGPVAISFKREKVDEREAWNGKPEGITGLYQYRLIVRSSELTTIRGSVLEDAIPSSSRLSSTRGLPAKEVLEYAFPELHLSALRLATAGPKTSEQLMKLDEQGITKTYKVGIMYCKSGQATEEEMYNNEHAGHAFDEFLDLIGERVRLKAFERYRGGLDSKTDSTGLYSLYKHFQDYEIMFHVSTMLPYTPNNRQQLLRKRHIGNDIVTIVFQEPGALPFTPKTVRSHFQHVFIIVQAHNPNTDNVKYRSKDVPSFGPPIPIGATFPKSQEFTDFLLTKAINAENAAHKSEKFTAMATRTRQEYLKDLATNFISTATLDSGSKLSKFSLGSGRKKDKARMRSIPDNFARAALVWNVQVEDFSQSKQLACHLGIGGENLVLMEEFTKEVIFTTPCKSVIGWTTSTNTVRLYYDHGECLVVKTLSPDVDEVQEIINRLEVMTQGCETVEMTLRRNSMRQLGFHVHFEGIVSEVEAYGFAWQAGLRPGSRLVEICKVATATLTHDQMIDLLRTSVTVKVVVIAPLEDGMPRRGCEVEPHSNYTSFNSYNTLSSSSSAEHSAPDDDASTTTSSRSTVVKTVSTHSKASSRLDKTSPHSNASSTNYSDLRAVSLNLDSRFSQAVHDKQSSHDSGASRSSGRGSGESQGSEGHLPRHFSADEYTMRDHRNTKDPADGTKGWDNRGHVGIAGAQDSQGEDQWYDVSGANNVDRDGYQKAYLGSTHGAYLSRSIGQIQNSAFTPIAQKGGSMNSLIQGGYEGPHRDGLTSSQSTDSGHAGHRNSGYGYNRAPSPSNPSYQGQSRYQDHSPQSDTSEARDRMSAQPNHQASNMSPMGRRRQAAFAAQGQRKSYLEASPHSSNSGSPRSSNRNLSGRSSEESLANRLRPGVTSSTKVTPNKGIAVPNTFQEDLLRLINPDTSFSESDLRQHKTVSASGPGRPPVRPPRLQRTLSDESMCGGGVRQNKSFPVDSLGTDVIFTTAKPVHVLGDHRGHRDPRKENRQTSRSFPVSNRGGHVVLTRAVPVQVISRHDTTPSDSHKEPKLSPRNSDLPSTALRASGGPPRTSSSPYLPLPDSGANLDWSNLVDVATKAFEGVEINSSKSASTGTISELSDSADMRSAGSSSKSSKQGEGKSYRDSSLHDRQSQQPRGAATSTPWRSSGTSNSPRIQELEARCAQLQQELEQERQHKLRLEAEIDHLRQDNVRLQEESQTAAAQLRRFTEWFFNTIDRQ